MRKLVLVRHAAPLIRADCASDTWPLSADGRDAAARAAEQLQPLGPEAIFTSPEPKARETAEIVARAVSLPVLERDGLREHSRTTVPLMDADAFGATVARAFEHPDDLVFGEETFAQALRRFRSAIDEICAAHPSGSVVVVSHGTVIALFVAWITRQSALERWREMPMPGWFVVEDASRRVVEGPQSV